MFVQCLERCTNRMTARHMLDSIIIVPIIIMIFAFTTTSTGCTANIPFKDKKSNVISGYILRIRNTHLWNKC